MTYSLEFSREALKEWRKLNGTVKAQFKNKLLERLKNPKVPKDKLSNLKDCYKIKLRSAGYRLVYQVIDEQIVVFVVGVGKRERSEVYGAVHQRIK